MDTHLSFSVSEPVNNTGDDHLSMTPETSDQNPRLEMPSSGKNSKKHPEDKRPGKKKKSLLGRIFKFLLFLAVIGSIAAAVLGYALYNWAASDLPSFSKVADYRPPQVTTVLARDGSLIGQFFREKRFLITLNDMAPKLTLAVLAVEDSEFYQHPGINLQGIIRAFLANLQSGTHSQGGSTLTQQVVKRLMLTPEKSYERKIKEAILAVRLEQQLSKDDILTIYLNQIFYGNNAYGVEAAARTYFAKHAKDLTLAECALIAGLPQSPSAYNPYRNPESAKNRQRHVLRRMRDLGWITDQEYDEALFQPLVYASMTSSMGPEGGWYLEEVRRQLIELFSEENSRKYGFDFGLYGEDVVYEMGLTVHTSMDPVQQHAADLALRKGLENATKRHGWNGSAENLQPSQYDEFLDGQNFAPTDLENGKWAQALVTEVSKTGAKVRMGGFHGFVSVKTMGWARTPNPKVAGSVTSTGVSDATKVLKPGDVIWVSVAPATPATKNKPEVPYPLAEASPGKDIPLKLEQYPDIQGALVSIEPETGDVVAMVGGYEFGPNASQFNRATQAKRQPGSSFKPFVYSAALDYGFTAGSRILDAPIILIDEVSNQAWRPQNFDANFEGPLILARALAKSKNLCTIRVVQQMGVEAVIARAKSLGLEPDFPPVLAISLGAVEVSPINMAQAYTGFANLGQVSTPRIIQSIQGPWGNTIYEAAPQHVQSISPQNAYIMSSLLKGVVNFGTGGKAKVLGRPVGGKTGSTNDEIDAWFVGVTPHLVTATYIGYDQIKPMGRGETGGNAALPIYVDYAKKALEAYPPDDFTQPEDIVFATVEGLSLPFIKGTEPGTGNSLNAVEGSGSPEAPTSGSEDLLMQVF